MAWTLRASHPTPPKKDSGQVLEPTVVNLLIDGEVNSLARWDLVYACSCVHFLRPTRSVSSCLLLRAQRQALRIVKNCQW